MGNGKGREVKKTHSSVTNSPAFSKGEVLSPMASSAGPGAGAEAGVAG